MDPCFLRPVSSNTAVPGATQATYFLQSKGHWFWSFFPHEGTGNLQVKWIRGRTPPGKVQWRPDYAADISIGIGHLNDFQFMRGLCLNIADRKFPLFLYMERPPSTAHRTSSCICLLAPTSRVQWKQRCTQPPLHRAACLRQALCRTQAART